ncbi:hypothetical protein ACJA29_00375 [Metamycoplasma sualvi]|uniref:hypothetical protein n=1 Tax=Metamycoplasma sualvi TaxID=2125 RepID=UPI003872C02A
MPAGTSSIKVRIVVTDSNKYIYGMGSSSGGPSVHSIDLNNISSLIDVDSNWFNEVSLTIANSGYLKDIQESDITTWKDSILNKSTALQTDSSLKNKVEIKFQIEGNNNWYIARDLVITLKSMINDYSGVNLGIIYLWDGTRGLKINAKFEKKNESDKIIFVSSLNSTNPNTNLEGQVQTNQVKTYIDLSSYINVLKSNKTSVVLQNGQAGTIQSFTPPAMTGNVGSGFLHGKTYDEIANRLQTLGITFKFNNNMDNNWNRKENVNTYNQNNPTLHLGFEYASNTNPNITIKINNNKEITSTTQEQNLVTLQLLAPVAITVDLNKLNQLKFEGNTKNISNSNSITTTITTIIDEIKNNYIALGDLSDLHLEIRFSLNNIKLEENISDSSTTEDGIWYTFDKLNEILSSSTTNYNTNAVLAKYYIKDNPQIRWS